MVDSDIRWAPNCLKTVISELGAGGRRARDVPLSASAGHEHVVADGSFRAQRGFHLGMLTARMLIGMDYAIGCTIATRRSEIEAIGEARCGPGAPLGGFRDREPDAWERGAR